MRFPSISFPSMTLGSSPCPSPQDLELREQPNLVATQLCFRFSAKGRVPAPQRRGEAAGVSPGGSMGIYGDNKKLIDSLVVFGSSYFLRNSATKHYDSGKNLGGFWYVKILDKLIASLVDESKGDFSSTN